MAIVPNLEMASFAALGFQGEVYDWRDEAGYQAAFEAAAPHLQDVRTIGVEGQSMRVFVAMALNEALPQARLVDKLREDASDLAGARERSGDTALGMQSFLATLAPREGPA